MIQIKRIIKDYVCKTFAVNLLINCVKNYERGKFYFAIKV